MPTEFEKAFAKAREKKLAQFTFNNKEYSTQLKEEPEPLLQMKLTDKIKQEYKKDPQLKYVSDYNTGLNKNEFNEFWKWAKDRYGSQDNVLYEMGAYDLQGAWRDIKEGKIDFDPETGHLPDTYKKPNHPTFSNESRYSSNETPGGEWEKIGDRWKYKPSKYTLENYGKKYVTDYLKNESDTEIDFGSMINF